MYDILVGDSLETLKTVREQSVQFSITSPPYYNMRSYLSEEDPLKKFEIGHEKTVEEYIQKLILIFREVRRILKNNGVLFVNIGDSFARAGGWSNNSGLDGVRRSDGHRAVSNISVGKSQKLAEGYKPKDLMLIPAKFAIAMCADGWYLRSEIVWYKPNGMPDSAKDRPSKRHEFIYMFSKSGKYFGNYAGLNDVVIQNVKPGRVAHIAAYPKELIEPFILRGSQIGDIILDPFSGSGTTGVVAVENHRDYIGCELFPDYAEMSRKLIESGKYFSRHTRKFS
jgi:site-specific DNA-methyltransferase (cytosine-N4-specific)